jgi:hypothetical protein
MNTINEKNYTTDEGKVFIHKETQEIMGWGICLGDDDSINNYEEVDCPEEFKGNKDYDNTIKKEENQYKLNRTRI